MEVKSIYKIFLVIIVVSLLISNGSYAIFVKSNTNDWITEIVDDSDDIWDNSIDIDSNNIPHICYWDYSSDPNEEQLKYSYKSNNNWNTEVIDDSSQSGAGCSIILDSNNKPHISYQSGDSGLSLYYAYKDDSGWIMEEVDNYGVSSYTSIDVDTNNNPHIAFYDCVEEGLLYAYKQNNQWNVEIVDFIDDGDGVGKYPSIDIDHNNNPHISYYDTVNNNLKYAVKNSGSWDIENVDTNDCGQYTSLSIDSNNNPHISYRKSSVLKYAYKNSGSWNIEVVDDSYDQPVISPTSITIDYNDIPHICYYHDDAYNRLKYAVKNSGSWDLDVILNEVSQYCNIAVDSDNDPHISFTDDSILKHAYKESDNPDNNDPTAYIDDISPNPADLGETISFQGHGSDSDGTITGYNWRSSIDGQLSTEDSFTKSDLSEGSHNIFFKVKDDDNSWSTEKSEVLVIGDDEDDGPDDLPNWAIGNKWIYDFNFEFLYSGVVEINGEINPLELFVEDIDEDSDEYILRITGDINANMKLFGIIPGGTYEGDVDGIVKVDKSTLAMKNFNFESDGSYASFGTHTVVTMSFDPSFDIFDFPIEESEDENNPWPAETYSELYIDFYVGTIHKEIAIEGGFEGEEIHFVKNEIHNGYNCKRISGNTGPLYGGYSKLWYSSDAGYLVDIQESINGWEGVDATLSMPLISTNYDQSNNPPGIPDIISGETNIYAGRDYTYTAETSDGEEDNIFYMFDWGDSFRSDWLGPYSSGSSVDAEHRWLKSGSYNVRVKAKDENDLESKWSDPLIVNVKSQDPITTVVIKKISKIDEIDYGYLWDPISDKPEWYYRVEVISSDSTTSTDFNYNTKDNTPYTLWNHNNTWEPNKEHKLICKSQEVVVTIKVMDHDYWFEFGDDLCDISGCNGDGPDNDISDKNNRGSIYYGTYNLIDNSFKSYSSKPGDHCDFIKLQDGFFVTSGEHKPDSSNSYDGNDGKVHFFVHDNYNVPTSQIVDPVDNARITEEISFLGGVIDGYSTDDIPYIWNWDFDDGKTSNLQNPTHIYNDAGTYTVTLTVTDAFDQTSSVSHTISIVPNEKPYKPNPPSGKSKGRVRRTHTYTAIANDPEEDDIWYEFDWGDGSYSDWFGPYESGESVSVSHKWDRMGSYNVRVRAKDTFDDKSEWSDPSPVKMDKYSDNILIRMFQRIIDMFPFTEDILQPIIDNIENQLENDNSNPQQENENNQNKPV